MNQTPAPFREPEGTKNIKTNLEMSSPLAPIVIGAPRHNDGDVRDYESLETKPETSTRQLLSLSTTVCAAQ